MRIKYIVPFPFDDLFPFDGQRCVHMADRVLARLHEEWA